MQNEYLLGKEVNAMKEVKWNLIIFSILLLAMILSGCAVEDNDDFIIVDDSAPARPRGVRSVTGDGQILIEWYPNEETDLKGYVIYRSFSEYKDYVEIATVGPKVRSYIDNDVKNGTTYYYAVTAFDYDGNESDLSPEIVDDTPRPAGKNVKLFDYILEPNRSGFDFSDANKGVQPFDRRGVDIYFGVGNIDGELTVPFIYATSDDVEMQDMGYTKSMDDVDMSPVEGFTFGVVEAIIGHTYCFYLPDNNFAKIRITDLKMDLVGDDVINAWVVFDWAYQLQKGNPELAPAKKGIMPVVGYKGGMK